MIAAASARRRGVVGGLRELRKLSAFARRDFLFAWSYRTAFMSDWVGLAVQAILLSFVGRLANDSALPSYNGHQASYMAFAMVGVLNRLNASSCSAPSVGVDIGPFLLGE